jgi:glycosyltransferase involved in cell wall biosynthesis
LKSVSVIVAFKNRDKIRVENFLESFLIQDYTNKELIFINQGSNDEISNYIEVLLYNKPQVKYIHNYTQGHLWNKSNALNIGIKNSSSDYVLILDVDLILPINYITNLFLYIKEDQFITPNAFYLDKNYSVNIRDLIVGKIPEKAIENFIGICLVKREVLDSIHGYDEFYSVWGAEDDDIIKRLQLFGLNRKILSAYELPSFHQWHKVLAPREPNHWYLEMVQYLFINNTLIRNEEIWGKVIEKKERYFHNHEIVFSEESKIIIEYCSTLLIFNDFIEMFFNETIKSGCVTIKIPVSNLRHRKYLFFVKESIDKNARFDICYNFLTYFISKNRNLILDYDFNCKAEELSFSYFKK